LKVFITGATGFIGTHVVEELTQAEHDIICLVRKTSQVDKLNKFNVSFCFGDVTEKVSFLEHMKGCDWVIHLANIYSFWEPNKQNYTEVNINGTRNVMEAVLETKVAKVAHISTVGVYGNTAGETITEETKFPTTHFSEYTRTKYAGDLIAWELYEKKDLPLVVIYPTAVIGPDDPKPAGQYIKRLIKGEIPSLAFSDTTITFVHVKDVASAIIKALLKDNNIGEKYIIGKHQLNYKEYSAKICEIAEVPVPKKEMSNFMAKGIAGLFTVIANLTKKPPKWDMSTDLVNMMTFGFKADGSKAERELGIKYTPIEFVLNEVVASCKKEVG